MSVFGPLTHPLMMIQLKGWRLVGFADGCAVLRSPDAGFRYIAIAPTTRGGDDFRGFAICYVPKDYGNNDASVLEVPKDELQKTVDKLLELDYIKRDQDENEFFDVARRWYTGLKIVQVTVTVSVVKTHGFVPIAAFDVNANDDLPIVSGNIPRPPLEPPATPIPVSRSTAEKRNTADDALEASGEHGTASKRRSVKPPTRYEEFELQKTDAGTTHLNKK